MSTLLETLASYIPQLIIRQHSSTSMVLNAPARWKLHGALLFTDISGFTGLTEQLAQRGPSGIEDLTRLLNTSFSQILDTISGEGGDVLTFAGDALLAFWPAEDGDLRPATQLAAQCALAIQRRMSGLYRLISSTPLSLRIGIASGEITLMRVGGMYQRWAFVVAGEPLTEIAAAEQCAQPGEVLVAPSAWALLQQNATATMPECAHAPGTMRLDTLTHTVVATPQPTPELLLEQQPILQSYVSGAVLSRIIADQASWLADLRRITVLFINLPQLDQHISLERAQAIMQTCQAALYRYEGSVNKISMDDKGVTLVAALGLPPLAHEDDAVRGVQAALAIRQALDALGQRYAIGVTTGRAFCGEIGSTQRREYTMIGAIVNLSARLMQAALKSQQSPILCDEATYLAARARLSFEPLEPIFVKGKSESVVVYRPMPIVEASDQQRSIQVAAQVPLHQGQMIGRTAEQALLLTEIQALAMANSGSVVQIEGEAGMGKSTLVSYLIQQASQLQLRTFQGGGNSIEASSPYSAWRGVFSQMLGIYDSQNLAQGQEQLRILLGDEHHDWWPFISLLNTVLPVDLPESDASQRLSAAARASMTRSLLLRLLQTAAQEPLLIILEDAHWFDSASWALALAMSQRMSNVLLLLTRRPPDQSMLEESEEAQLLAHTKLRISLSALPADDSLSLVCQRLGVDRLPEAIAAIIRAKAQGNPFFTEELAYALRDTSVIQIEGRECRLASGADLRTLAFPETVQTAIVSRIDRLPPAIQLTLKAASVIGRVFPVRTLAAIHPIHKSEQHLSDDLTTLEQRDLTFLDSAEQDLSYSFKHAITQDVVYDLMLFAQRRQLHRAVALWYEQSHANELGRFYALLAYHWNRAGVADRALDYFKRAAQQALAVDAAHEALIFLEQAHEIVSLAFPDNELIRLQSEMQINWLQGEAQRALGIVNLAKQHYTHSLQIARRLDDHRGIIDALSHLGQVATDTGNFDEARDVLEECYARSHSLGDRALIAHASEKLGYMASRVGSYDESERYYDESLHIYTDLDDQRGVAQILHGMGFNMSITGKQDIARFYYLRSLEIRRAINDRLGIAATSNNLAWVCHLQQQYDQSHIYYKEALSIAYSLDNQRLIGILLNNQGFTFYATSDYGAAQACFDKALPLAWKMGAMPFVLETMVGMALLLAKAGQYIEAVELIGLALSHPATNVDVGRQARDALPHIEAHISADQIEAALKRGRSLDLAKTVAALCHFDE